MKKVWGFFWLLSVLMGVSTLYSVVLLPSEEKNAVWMGLSRNKLALCAGIVFLMAICLTGAVLAFLGKTSCFAEGKGAGIAAYVISMALIAGRVFLFPPVGRTAFERSLAERLLPLAYWGLTFSALAFILLLIQKRNEIRSSRARSAAPYIWSAVFLLLSICALEIGLRTGIGMDPISGTFYRQGVSLLEGHVVLPLLILIPLLPFFMLAGPALAPKKKLNAVLSLTGGLLIWAAAVYFWQTAPFEGRSYFAPALRLPNENFYPASDAENYDLLAQSILLGNGFRNGLVIVRPLYAAFLALLHLIFGNDYMRLTNGQIMLLALIPVLVFLIGKHLRSAAAGILAAAWVIWREVYSIRLSPLVQVSNSRLLMSDLPTAFLVLAVVLCAVKWASSERRSVRALLCGGLAGAAMLLRTQCFVLIPALWLYFMIAKVRKSAKWSSVLLSALGLLMVFAPWFFWQNAHPYQTSDPDAAEGQYLVSLYRKAVGETDPSKGLAQLIREHPAETLKAAASHFINNEVSSLLVLPVRGSLPEEADALFYEPDLFWYRANASEAVRENLPLILVYLAVISFGIASACRKASAAGIAPLLFHLVYDLGNSFALTSGFRFTLPVDWVYLLYFALGCVSLLSFINNALLFRFTGVRAEPGESGSGGSHSAAFFIPACLGLLILGAVLPVCDGFIPKRYAERDMQSIFEEWQSRSVNADQILAAHRNEPLVFLEGRAFYPRFYAAGEGDSGGSSSVKRYMGFDRLVWMFHDNSVKVLCCPLLPEQVPDALKAPVPDPVDVLVAGLQREDYIEVLELLRVEAPGDR